MSPNKQHQAYKNNAVNTASGAELTLMLYNGCIKFIKQAMKDLDSKNYEAKNTNIQKAQKIIQELMITLDPKIEISNQFLPLYEYMLFQLKEANIKNDTSLLEEVLGYTIEFRDTWKQVILETRKKQYAQGAHV
ncbi:MAG: flagellar export chaperone FliS [Bacillota bacterium]|uniref:Flagellar secretion chaperone FliS n=1 Tax=Virgibacillus salarius TaxID=447199 RepID=A0A941DYF3_9BACI|nr:MULTISPECIES: flagellar export chaperone FliS [Bacillaceae]MBR7797887.1 flagellar export chaperone FliS [Virgibacillus salarius]MDY7042874.1 flagellar export chaperone FliS [Virgibacillus sp. M23]NAZ10597.1 flagellar export chaperone FliS [Agaribacter marinus]WBX78647.1 flagellar export chaperone FliS [Virgibacillus salarius]